MKCFNRLFKIGVFALTLSIFCTGVLAESDVKKFDIAPQEIRLALKEFSDITGMQFIYTESSIGEIPVSGLAEELNTTAALEKLLKGTGVQFEYVNDNTVRLFMPSERVEPKPAKKTVSSENNLSTRTLEEIVVTSQKREESLQDVPITVSVVTGEAIRSAGVKNLQELSVSVPNLYIAESFVGDSIFVRGVGSGQNNLGFEQAVGQVIDGFFYGRSRFSRATFLDVERVEVLKGPQGSLLGKNTTAGAINVTSAKPTREFEAWVSPTWEFDADEGLSIEGAVSGPLSENFAARLAFNYVDRDGFIKNTTTGEDDVSVDDLVARASLAWDINDDVDVLFQYQYGKLDREGGNNQYSLCDTSSQQVPTAPVNVNFTSIFLGLAPDDCKANYTRTGTAGNGINIEGKETNFDTYALTINWDFDEYTLTSLTGYAAYDYRDVQDGDRTSVDVVTNGSLGTAPDFAEDYEHWSQELRITSDDNGEYHFIAGFYFLEKEQDTDYKIHFNNIAGLAAARNIFTHEEGTTYAAFGQVTYHLNPQWDLSVGGRYTYEKKEAKSIQFPTLLYSLTPLACGLPVAGVCFTHDINNEFDEENVSPSVAFQWRPDDDSMYYASLKRGFKAGGYDHLLVSNQATDPEIFNRFRFDSEEVTSYELGMKLTFAEGTAQFNGAIFYSDFEDLQLGGFLNSTELINTVTNAGTAESQGVEFDLRWLATDRLTLFAAAAYLDSRYGEYENAPCYTLQATGCVNGRQDLTDKKLQFASDWKANINAEYIWPLSRGLELTGFVQLSYVSDFPLQADLDPKLWQGGYTKFDARLTLSHEENGWEVSIIGKNLSDKLTSNYGDDVPAQAGSVWRSVDAPRAIALQAKIRF